MHFLFVFCFISFFFVFILCVQTYFTCLSYFNSTNVCALIWSIVKFVFVSLPELGFWLVPTSEDEKQSELESYESNDAESVVDSDAERSDNDFEVMEILGQIEPTQQKTQNEIKLAENRPEENNISDVKDEDVERSDSRSSHKVSIKLDSSGDFICSIHKISFVQDNEMKPPSPSFDETFVEDTLIAHTDDVPIENTLTTHSTHITNEHKDTLQTSEQNVQANTSVQVKTHSHITHPFGPNIFF